MEPTALKDSSRKRHLPGHLRTQDLSPGSDAALSVWKLCRSVKLMMSFLFIFPPYTKTRQKCKGRKNKKQFLKSSGSLGWLSYIHALRYGINMCYALSFPTLAQQFSGSFWIQLDCFLPQGAFNLRIPGSQLLGSSPSLAPLRSSVHF